MDGGAIGAGGGSDKERPFSGVLAPWDLPAAKLLRPGKKSELESAESYEELWAYLTAPAALFPYRSELCSTKQNIRGVAISRWAEGMAGICEAIVSADLAPDCCISLMQASFSIVLLQLFYDE